MQQIEFPDDQFQRLTAVAHAAGYDDLSAFMASFIDDTTDDPRGDLSEEQLRENVAAMQRGEADISANGGTELKDAIYEIADKYDLDVRQ